MTAVPQQPPLWLFAFFPFLFLGMWLLITTIIAHVSGWFVLQARYPDADEPALLKLGGLSGSMAIGGSPMPASFRGILTLSACPSGLRVSMNRIFGPFTRPFFVPWEQIRVESKTGLLGPRVTLSFGDPAAARMTIETYIWQRLAERAGKSSGIPESERVERSGLARTLLIQWLAVTGFMATFFIVVSRVAGGPGLPLTVCIGFPTLVVGVPALIHYLRIR